MTHTAGFPNWRWFNPRGTEKLELFFTPGHRYAYSGEGLLLLQNVIEIKTKHSLEEYARELIFEPFNMRRTSMLWRSRFETNFANGHTMDGDTIEKDRRDKVNAAGSMETTIADFTRFVQNMLFKKGLSDKHFKEMIHPQVYIHTARQFPSLDSTLSPLTDSFDLAYGLGWGLFNSSQGPVFFKEGHGDGWQHYMIAFPEKRSAYIFMANSDNAESIYTQLV